jgi:hypothetical protein
MMSRAEKDDVSTSVFTHPLLGTMPIFNFTCQCLDSSPAYLSTPAATSNISNIGCITSPLCQTIIKAATSVPEAFDTSFDLILHEDRESVVKVIQKSMSTKTALSLVSKLFHIRKIQCLLITLIVSLFLLMVKIKQHQVNGRLSRSCLE